MGMGHALGNEVHDQNKDQRKVTMCIANPFKVYYSVSMLQPATKPK